MIPIASGLPFPEWVLWVFPLGALVLGVSVFSLICWVSYKRIKRYFAREVAE